MLLNADRLADAGTPALTRLGGALVAAERQRCLPALPDSTGPDSTGPESWTDWWSAAQADPALAGPVAERDRRRAGNRGADHGDESEDLSMQVRALRAAGFAEIGTVWQHGTSRVLAAVTPG